MPPSVEAEVTGLLDAAPAGLAARNFKVGLSVEHGFDFMLILMPWRMCTCHSKQESTDAAQQMCQDHWTLVPRLHKSS